MKYYHIALPYLSANDVLIYVRWSIQKSLQYRDHLLNNQLWKYIRRRCPAEEIPPLRRQKSTWQTVGGLYRWWFVLPAPTPAKPSSWWWWRWQTDSWACNDRLWTLSRVMQELQLAESRPEVGSSKNITGGLFTWWSWWSLWRWSWWWWWVDKLDRCCGCWQGKGFMLKVAQIAIYSETWEDLVWVFNIVSLFHLRNMLTWCEKGFAVIYCQHFPPITRANLDITFFSWTRPQRTAL